MKSFSQFVYGAKIRGQYTTNQTVIFSSENDSQCEVAVEDMMTLIMKNGQIREESFTFIEDNAIVTKSNEYIDFSSIALIGRQ